MPRTTTLECPGCPPLRALTFDMLGLIKVVEARNTQRETPKVVERWGDLDPSKCVLVASMNDSKSNPLLAVARKNGTIEVLNPLNGQVNVSILNSSDVAIRPESDSIVGLHLFAKKNLDLTPRSCRLLTCTTKGNASIRSTEDENSPSEHASACSSRTWNVCASGNILFSKVDGTENYALFGGKGVEVNLWDLDKSNKIWTAKSPPKNNLGIFTPTWFTSASFVGNDDHRKFVAGTNCHQVRLYDISAQRRPVISMDFRETPIKAVTQDLDGHTVYVGNASGDLASFDIRTGKQIGSFVGKCSGSIRSIARHPEHPLIASCGLDGYLRFWDTKTRQSLSAVFLKQHLTGVVFDSNFEYQEVTNTAADVYALDEQNTDDMLLEKEIEEQHLKRKKSKKNKAGSVEPKNDEEIEEHHLKKGKSKKNKERSSQEPQDDEEVDEPHLKRRKSKKNKEGSTKEDRNDEETKKSKKKKQKRMADDQ